jgi:hypothetical protein
MKKILILFFIFCRTVWGQYHVATINFGNVPVGGAAVYDVAWDNPSTTNAYLTHTATPSVFTITQTPNGMGSSSINTVPGYYTAFIRITFRPTASQSYSGTLTTVSTGTGQKPANFTSTITLNGTGISAPILAISSTSINFDEVEIGTSLQKNVTISNTGSATLTISKFSIGVGFTIPLNPPININSNNSYQLPIKFSPTEIKMYTGSITLTHNATGSPTTIQLGGTGAWGGGTEHANKSKLQMLMGDK